MSFTWSGTCDTFTLKIEGDFRSGTKFTSFEKRYEDLLLMGYHITLNLTKVVYMDSDTMEFVFNHKGSKIMPLDSKVTERYLDYVNSRHEVEVK